MRACLSRVVLLLAEGLPKCRHLVIHLVTQAGSNPWSTLSIQKSHFTAFPVTGFHWGVPQGQAVMQALQPTQSLSSTNTMPSLGLFCMAPVGQAATHQGSW